MALLGQVGIENPLPVSPYAIQGLLNGRSGISGTLGALSTLSNSSFGTNHVYAPNDGTWTSQQLNANASGIAGTQGAAMQIFQQVSAHYPVIQALRDHLMVATTPKDVADAQAQPPASIPQPLTGQWEKVLAYVPPFYSGPYGSVPNGDGAIGSAPITCTSSCSRAANFCTRASADWWNEIAKAM